MTYQVNTILNTALLNVPLVKAERVRRPNRRLPTQDELPSSDGVPMETERHKK